MSAGRRATTVSVDDTRGPTRRLTVQFASLVLVVIAVVGVIVYGIVAANVTESVERALRTAVEIDEPDEAPPGTFVTIVDGPRIDTTDRMPQGLVDLDAIRTVSAGTDDEIRGARTVDGRTYQMLTARSGDRDHDARVVQAAVDDHEGGEELYRLTTALVVAGLAAGGLSIAAACVMARRAVRPLADALALQRRFVADASHELRTPLTILSTRAQLLARTPRAELPAPVSRGIDDIVEDTRGLTAILEDLLIAADPRTAPDPEPVDLASVSDVAVSLLEPLAHQRGIAVTRTGATDPVETRGSGTAVKRLVVALGTNALDHAASVVTVHVERNGASALLCVTDDGPGFTPGTEANAFERFASSRADTGTDRHYGLGLAVAAEIVQRHGGSVRVVGGGPGATIECRFPAVR